MRFLYAFAIAPFFLFAFNQEAFDEIDSITQRNGTEPLDLVNERLAFYTKDSIGSFDTHKDKEGHRYFKYVPAQKGNGPVLSYRFPEKLNREAINEKRLTPTRMTYLQNEWKSLIFRTFEISSDAKSLSTYQECWQIAVGAPELQCVIVNKAICDRVNRGNYDWDKNYRKDAQAFRKDMIARFEAEVLPEPLNQKLSLSFLSYKVLDSYDNTKPDLVTAFGGGIQMRLEAVCKSFSWSEEAAIESGFKH